MVTGGHKGLRGDMARAARRLSILECLMLVAAAGMSLGGGALAALWLSELTNAPFRVSWFISSLLLFGVPGFLVLRRESRRAPSRRGAGNPQD